MAYETVVVVVVDVKSALLDVPGTLLRDTVVVADMAAAYLGYSEHTLD